MLVKQQDITEYLSHWPVKRPITFQALGQEEFLPHPRNLAVPRVARLISHTEEEVKWQKAHLPKLVAAHGAGVNNSWADAGIMREM